MGTCVTTNRARVPSGFVAYASSNLRPFSAFCFTPTLGPPWPIRRVTAQAANVRTFLCIPPTWCKYSRFYPAWLLTTWFFVAIGVFFTLTCSVKGRHADADNSLRCGTCGSESHEAFCPSCRQWDCYPGSKGESTLTCKSPRCRGRQNGKETPTVTTTKFFQVYCEVRWACCDRQ